MIEDGFSYPFEGDEAVKSLVIGGIMNLLGFLLLPIFIVQGYLIACIRTSVQGYDQPPVFQDWGTLLVDGLKAFVISFVYSFVPMIIFFVLMFVLAGAGSATDSGGIVAGFGMLFFVLLFLVYLVIAYLVPAALSHFAVEGGIGAGFDFGTITTVVTHGEYLKAYVAAIAAGFVLTVIYVVLSFTVIGLIVVPWVAFYFSVALFRMYATAYAEATGGQPGAQGTDSQAGAQTY